MIPANAPQTERLVCLRDYVAKDKPKVARKDFAFAEPLAHGWLLRYLLPLESYAWGRWEHWSRTQEAGQILEPIPQIAWASEHGEHSPGWKALDRSLNAVTKCGEWAGWSSWVYMDYFLDWLLFGFGDNSQPEAPQVPGGCEGASERLYQIFNLEPLLAHPYDYLGDILASNNFGRRSGFYPTPMEVGEAMAKMQMMEGEDCRGKTVCDPCCGTGRLLLCASNYSYRLFGNDINRTVIKATLINGYLYAPWLVKPFSFFNKPQAPAPELLQDVQQVPALLGKPQQMELIPV